MVGVRGPRHLAVDRDKSYCAAAVEQVVAPLPRRLDGTAELALEQINNGSETTGIDEVGVSLATEESSRGLQLFELVRHENIVPNRRSLSINYCRDGYTNQRAFPASRPPPPPSSQSPSTGSGVGLWGV